MDLQSLPRSADLGGKLYLPVTSRMRGSRAACCQGALYQAAVTHSYIRADFNCAYDVSIRVCSSWGIAFGQVTASGCQCVLVAPARIPGYSLTQTLRYITGIPAVYAPASAHNCTLRVLDACRALCCAVIRSALCPRHSTVNSSLRASNP